MSANEILFWVSCVMLIGMCVVYWRAVDTIHELEFKLELANDIIDELKRGDGNE